MVVLLQYKYQFDIMNSVIKQAPNEALFFHTNRCDFLGWRQRDKSSFDYRAYHVRATESKEGVKSSPLFIMINVFGVFDSSTKWKVDKRLAGCGMTLL